MDVTTTHDYGTTPTAPHALRDVDNGDNNGDRLPKTNAIPPHAEVEIGNGATSPVPDPGAALSSPAEERPRCGAGGYQGGLYIGMLENPELAKVCGAPLNFRYNTTPLTSGVAAQSEETQSSRNASGVHYSTEYNRRWGMTPVAGANTTSPTDPCPNGGVSLGQWAAAAAAASPACPSTPATCSVKVSASADLLTLAPAAMVHPHDVLYSYFNGQNNAKSKSAVAQSEHRPNKGASFAE
jgi:hypothetical protein